ncbi:MAG: hypothetical protein OXM55_06700 [Bdellovibrionales bacterium]|nr:hypothetical protein [Bdellovibrionales bacterium]
MRNSIIKYLRLLLISLLAKRYLFILPILTILPFAEGIPTKQCPVNIPLIADMQNIVCSIPSLSEAIQKDSILRKIGKVDPFASHLPHEVVRSVDTLSFMNQTVKHKIASVHQKYQENGADNYTLSTAFYPSNIKEDSCPKEYQTITGPPQYSPLKNPNFFQVVKYKNKLTICERVNKARQGPGALPACSKIKKDSEDICVSLDEFESLSRKLLGDTGFEKQYCPRNCSYYIRKLQRVHQNPESVKTLGRTPRNGNKFCSDNYLILHCGPKKKGSKYNLRIREVKNLCSDLGTCIL